MSKEKNLSIKDFPYIDENGVHFASELWQTSFHMEENTMPSMVENCYNPSIADILANPSLAAHSLTPHYEDESANDEVPTEWDNDIQDIYNLGGSQGAGSTPGMSDVTSEPANGAKRSPQAKKEQDSGTEPPAGEPEGAQRPSDELEE